MKGSVDMKRFDLIIVGAGPSGLSAAIEAAKRGLEVVVFDENEKPGSTARFLRAPCTRKPAGGVSRSQ